MQAQDLPSNLIAMARFLTTKSRLICIVTTYIRDERLMYKISSQKLIY